jgi:hypothetical protein
MAVGTDHKLLITPLPKSGLAPVSVMFNPNSYSISKSVTWSPGGVGKGGKKDGKNGNTDRSVNAPTLVFGGGGGRQLSLDLFFDVTEPIDGVMVKDVREKTDAIVALTRIEPKQGRPPVCKVSWGSAPNRYDFPFTGVITSLSQRFTLFRRTGEPVRANLGLSFLEFLDPEIDQKITDPELTTRMVRRGDTLPSIAAEVYGDSMLWRVIADANDIDNPRALIVGVTLTIPKMS